MWWASRHVDAVPRSAMQHSWFPWSTGTASRVDPGKRVTIRSENSGNLTDHRKFKELFDEPITSRIYFHRRSDHGGCRRISARNGLQRARPTYILRHLFPRGHRQAANERALQSLTEGGSLIDAIEQGIRLVEADASNSSVGLGGAPIADGIVQLDACMMDGVGHRAGSVAGWRDPAPISIARAAMDRTRHVLLVGNGAAKFAEAAGIEEAESLTAERRKGRRNRDKNKPMRRRNRQPSAMTDRDGGR